MPESVENMLPEKINAPANKDLINSPEKTEIKNFTPEDIEGLKNDGYLIFDLSPKSIKELKKEGCHIETDPLPGIEDIPGSINGQVAIKPSKPVLRIDGKNEKETVDEYSKELTDKFSGVKAIIPNSTDAARLLLKYKERVGKNLLVGNYEGDSIITDSPAFPWEPHPSGNGKGIIVTQKREGIQINQWGGGHGAEFMRVVPFVVPK